MIITVTLKYRLDVTASEVAMNAVSWSAAAVHQPIAGEIDPDYVARLATHVLMEETP